MSIQRDRFTFFAVLAAVCVAVFGYVKLGNLYPTTGRAATAGGDPSISTEGADASGAAAEGETGTEEEAGHSVRPGAGDGARPGE